jgi:hypothetical protein
VSGHRRAARQDGNEVIGEPEPECGGRGTLRNVQERDGDRDLEAERAPDVRRPNVSAPERADVDTGREARQPVPPRQRAEQIAHDDGECVFQA